MKEGIQVFSQSELIHKGGVGCMVKKGDDEAGQDCMGPVFGIDLLSGLRSLSLVMNEPTWRN